MLRTWITLLLLAVFAADAASAFAQADSAAPMAGAPFNMAEPWPVRGGDYALEVTKFPRGGGSYLSWFKLGLTWLMFLGWVYTSDWINRDAQARQANYLKWNSMAVFGFLLALILTLLLPWYTVSFVLLLATWLAPVLLYVRERNAGLESSERLLTREHFRSLINTRLKKTGVQIKEKSAEPAGPPIELSGEGGATERDDKANTLKARQSAGFRPTGEMLIDAILHRASLIVLDFTKESVAVKYQIDGVLTDQPKRDRQGGDAILEAMKTLAGLNPADRVTRQQGIFSAKHEKTRFTCRLASQGIKTGERAMLQLDDGTARKARLESINMPEKTQAALKALVAEPGGLVIVSAPPRGGLTTLMTATVTGVDRFMRSVLAMENETNQDIQVENVPVKTYNVAAGKTPAAVLLEVIRQYPDVFVVPELIDGEIATTLCNEVLEEKRLVIAGMRATEAAEALLKAATLKPPPKQFLAALAGVVNVRLVRKLCTSCKEAYKPAPALLQQLGLTPDKVESFYQPKKPPVVPEGKKPPPPCADCGGVGYKGQTAMFELLIVNDALRQALRGQADVKAVRQLGRKVGMKTLQEEGIQLVVSGETSIQELMRVLKKEETKTEG